MAGISTLKADRPGEIRTPDQRLRVFVSSTLHELAEERRAARRAIERLYLAPVMFELGARPHPPRTLYRAYLEQSHVFIGIYWQSYGWVASDMEISGIEDEYRLSEGKPSLIYIRSPAPDREPALADLIARVESDDRASYKYFETPEELEELISQDLSLMLSERFEPAGPAPGVIARRPLPVPPTPLVGREEDVEAICGLLRREDVRLLTLTGVGGIGKTRLAIEAAARLEPTFPDGVHLVDLSSVRDPDLLATAVGAALQIPNEGTRPAIASILDRLADTALLLVLDNFEQVVESGPVVARVLAGCPKLQVLVTSRVILYLRGEHEYRVLPLAIPEGEGRSRAKDVLRSPAVRLFLDRAEESQPGFALTDDNAWAVREICQRLDGIPLALELAAAPLRILTPELLVERLGDRLDLLAGPSDLPARQRTLRATIEWSYRLLGDQERRVFERLSVFPGGFTMEAAQAVCDSRKQPDVLDALSALVEQSLLIVQDIRDVDPRFRMLETIRGYALERLAERGEADDADRRMAEYFVGFAEEGRDELLTSQHEAWMRLIDAEVDNIRAVLDRAMARADFGVALRVAVPLGVYWWVRGLVGERREAVERVYPSRASLPIDLRSLLLWGLGIARFITGDHVGSIAPLRELAQIQEQRGDEHGLAMARAMLGTALPYETDGEGKALLTRAVDTLRRLGDRWGTAWALTHLGELAMLDGDLATAERLHQEGLADARIVGSNQMQAQALNQLGLDALLRGEVEAARSSFVQSAEILRAIWSSEGLAYSLDGLAGVALARHRAREAAVILRASELLREEIGVAVWPLLRPVTEKLLADIRAAVGDDTFEQAGAQAAALSTDDVIKFALTATGRDTSVGGPPSGGRSAGASSTIT